ncbi:hypothetical protein FORC098_1967 [Salmonella enterica subsp. enterica serovar Typhimurium]|nr:hypothetical protein FORC098_1967 [Salmonella enterica subsp. enterica serovar Typhimurium]
MSADDIPNAGEKRWLSIEAGLLLRAHGFVTRPAFYAWIFPQIRQRPTIR